MDGVRAAPPDWRGPPSPLFIVPPCRTLLSPLPVDVPCRTLCSFLPVGVPCRTLLSLLPTIPSWRELLSTSLRAAFRRGALSSSPGAVLFRAASARRVVPSVLVVEVERRDIDFASVVVASGAGPLATVDLSAASASAAGVAGAAPAFSALVLVRARVVELLRRDVAGFVTCSWLTAAALSDFWRLVRLRVVAGFACSCVSGDSDVSFMKKTPFYIWVCRIDSAGS